MCALVHRVRGFQKRWVKLDVDYLSYFDNDKVTANMYSHKHYSLTRNLKLDVSY